MWLKTLKYKTNIVFGPKMPWKHICIWMHMSGTKETQSSIGDETWNVETKKQTHQENKSLVNHKKRIREEENKHRRSLPTYNQCSVKVERENIYHITVVHWRWTINVHWRYQKDNKHRRSLPMIYQHSLMVERENISYHRRSLTMNYQRSLKIAKR